MTKEHEIAIRKLFTEIPDILRRYGHSVDILEQRLVVLEGILLNRGRSLARAKAGVNGEAIARDAITFTAGFFQKKTSILIGPSRRRVDVHPRWIAIRLARKHSGLGLTQIGEIFHRDHSAINNALKTLDDDMAQNADLRQQVITLETEFQTLLNPQPESEHATAH